MFGAVTTVTTVNIHANICRFVDNRIFRLLDDRNILKAKFNDE